MVSAGRAAARALQSPEPRRPSKGTSCAAGAGALAGSGGGGAVAMATAGDGVASRPVAMAGRAVTSRAVSTAGRGAGVRCGRAGVAAATDSFAVAGANNLLGY